MPNFIQFYLLDEKFQMFDIFASAPFHFLFLSLFWSFFLSLYLSFSFVFLFFPSIDRDSCVVFYQAGSFLFNLLRQFGGFLLAIDLMSFINFFVIFQFVTTKKKLVVNFWKFGIFQPSFFDSKILFNMIPRISMFYLILL